MVVEELMNSDTCFNKRVEWFSNNMLTRVTQMKLIKFSSLEDQGLEY